MDNSKYINRTKYKIKSSKENLYLYQQEFKNHLFDIVCYIGLELTLREKKNGVIEEEIHYKNKADKYIRDRNPQFKMEVSRNMLYNFCKKNNGHWKKGKPVKSHLGLIKYIQLISETIVELGIEETIVDEIGTSKSLFAILGFQYEFVQVYAISHTSLKKREIAEEMIKEINRKRKIYAFQKTQ